MTTSESQGNSKGLRQVQTEARKQQFLWSLRERSLISRNVSPWPNFDQSVKPFERTMQPLLGNESLYSTLDNIRDAHNGKLVCLNIGSNYNQLQEYAKPGDTVINVALQDLPLTKEYNERTNNFHFISGSIGVPKTWERINILLNQLQEEGKIDKAKINFCMSDMIGGWESIPYKQGNGIWPRRLREESYSSYKQWLADNLLNVMSRNSLALIVLPLDLKNDVLALESSDIAVQAGPNNIYEFPLKITKS